jgi:hypothetical protein
MTNTTRPKLPKTHYAVTCVNFGVVSGRVKILDFGLAKLAGPAVQEGLRDSKYSDQD